MNRKHIGVIAALTAASFALTGCGPGDGPSAADGDPQAACSISFLTFQSPVLPASFWEAEVDRLHEQFPNLTVDIQYTPGLDRQAYATQLLAAGNLPDVILDVPLQEFVDAEALMPYDEDAWQALGIPDEVARVDGKHYGLAIGSQPTPMIFYNADVFAELGLQEPTTWDEFVAVSAAIKSAGRTPLLIGGGSDPWTSTMLLGGIINTDVMADNPEWVMQRKNGEVQFADADFRAAVQKWADLVQAGYLNDDAMALGYDQLIGKYLNGEGVMYPMGAWASAQTADFEQGVFLLPTNDGGRTVMGNTPAAEIYLSATTECPAQAQSWALALGQSKEFASAWLTADALFPLVEGFELPSEIAPLIADTFQVMSADEVEVVNPWGWMNGERALPAGFGNEFDKGAQVLFADGDVDAFLTRMDVVFDDLSSQ